MAIFSKEFKHKDITIVVKYLTLTTPKKFNDKTTLLGNVEIQIANIGRLLDIKLMETVGNGKWLALPKTKQWSKRANEEKGSMKDVNCYFLNEDLSNAILREFDSEVISNDQATENVAENNVPVENAGVVVEGDVPWELDL